jgi:hypothetical protein
MLSIILLLGATMTTSIDTWYERLTEVPPEYHTTKWAESDYPNMSLSGVLPLSADEAKRVQERLGTPLQLKPWGEGNTRLGYLFRRRDTPAIGLLIVTGQIAKDRVKPGGYVRIWMVQPLPDGPKLRIFESEEPVRTWIRQLAAPSP